LLRTTAARRGREQGNFRRRLSKDDFRAFVHPPSEMHEALQASGLERVSRAHTLA